MCVWVCTAEKQDSTKALADYQIALTTKCVRLFLNNSKDISFLKTKVAG